MRHQDLTFNHRLESWVYANAAARTTATGFVPGDVGRISFQNDNGTYWRLLSTTPTWQLVSPSPVYLQTIQLTIATTTSTAGVMCGIGATCKLTPVKTGIVHVIFNGYGSNNSAGGGTFVTARYGTGVAPANGGPPSSGSPVPGTGALMGVAGNPVSLRFPFTVGGIVSGLTLGTTYWFDCTQQVLIGGTSAVIISFTGFELG